MQEQQAWNALCTVQREHFNKVNRIAMVTQKLNQRQKQKTRGDQVKHGDQSVSPDKQAPEGPLGVPVPPQVWV